MGGENWEISVKHPMKSLLLVPILFALSLPAAAEVDPKAHKLCLEAKDYQGCVRAMTGASGATEGQRTIIQQGASLADGNECPAGWAYIGGGNCSEVKCEYNSSGFNDLGHDQRVAGKPGWGCKYSWWQGVGVMRLTGITRAVNNPKCPPGEPPIGYNSTCQTKGN